MLETSRDLLLAHASHWLDGRHVAELDRALADCPPVDTDPQVRFLHACRAYLVKDWEQLVRHTEPLLGDSVLGIEAGLFGGMARVRLEMCGQAEPLLAAALMRCRSEQPQRKELRYWLARAYEGTGRTAAAVPLYRAVHRVDPAFMDTAARLAAIHESDDGLDEGAGLAAVSLAGNGQSVPEGADGLETFAVDFPPDPSAGAGPSPDLDEALLLAGPLDDGLRDRSGPPLDAVASRPSCRSAAPIPSCSPRRSPNSTGWSAWSRSSARCGRCRRSCGWPGCGPARACRCSRRNGTSSSPARPAPARPPSPASSAGSSTPSACSAATTWWRPNAPTWSASSSARPRSRPMS